MVLGPIIPRIGRGIALRGASKAGRSGGRSARTGASGALSKLGQRANVGDINEALEGAAEDAGIEAYEYAMSLCGNPGQESIIGDMGEYPFIEGAQAFIAGEDPRPFLFDSCGHPDAVDLILEEAAQLIEGVMLMSMEDLGGDPYL